MLKFLIEAFKASKGRMPNNMEMILLKQKAAKQSVDERKVVSMFDRSAVNPNKPILGGKNIQETEILDTSDEIEDIEEVEVLSDIKRDKPKEEKKEAFSGFAEKRSR